MLTYLLLENIMTCMHTGLLTSLQAELLDFLRGPTPCALNPNTYLIQVCPTFEMALGNKKKNEVRQRGGLMSEKD